MRVIMMLLLLFQDEWTDIVHCGAYNSRSTGKLGRGIVLAFSESKAMTYVYETGYITWNIDKCDYIQRDPKTDEIMMAEYQLSGPVISGLQYVGLSIVKISPAVVIQFVHLEIDNNIFNFSIEFTRKDVHRKRN